MEQKKKNKKKKKSCSNHDGDAEHWSNVDPFSSRGDGS